MRIARIENGFVQNVISVSFETVSDAVQNLKLSGEWVSDEHGKAGVGFEYDSESGSFIPPKPFPSWILNTQKEWVPPLPRPQGDFEWSEAFQQWIENLPPINLNQADLQTLTTLDGVGQTRAQAIINGRPWSQIEDLAHIDGVSLSMIQTWNITT